MWRNPFPGKPTSITHPDLFSFRRPVFAIWRVRMLIGPSRVKIVLFFCESESSITLRVLSNLIRAELFSGRSHSVLVWMFMVGINVEYFFCVFGFVGCFGVGVERWFLRAWNGFDWVNCMCVLCVSFLLMEFWKKI